MSFFKYLFFLMVFMCLSSLTLTHACDRYIKIKEPVDLHGEVFNLPKNSKLVFSGAGFLFNGVITGNSSTIEVETGRSVFGRNLSIKGTWKNDIINMSWFDCSRDGSQDVLPTFKIVSEMIAANGGGILVLDKDADYLVCFADDPSGGYTLFPDRNAIAFDFRHLRKVKVDMNGSTIRMSPSASTKYAFFLFYDCSEYEVCNGSLTGDVFNHNYSNVFYLGRTMTSPHAWGEGILAYGSKGSIHDVSISNMTGDGILVASYKSSNTVFHAESHISNTTISYCRRCGIGCGSSKSLKIAGCHIHHIGTWDGMQGTAPQDGINLEYEDLVYDEGDIIISGCVIEHCTQKTISASNSTPPRPHDLLIDSCHFQGSVLQIANVEQSGKKSVISCSFINAPIHLGACEVDNCSFEWHSDLNYINSTIFRNCSFQGELCDLVRPYGVCFASTSSSPAIFEKCSFKDIRGMNDRSEATQGFSGYAFPIVAEFRSCTFDNCSFVQGVNKKETSYTFYDSVLKNGCMLFNEAGNPMRFYKTVLDNVDSFRTQDGLFYYEECDIIQDNPDVVNPLLYFGTHTVSKCKVKNNLNITPKMKRAGVIQLKIKEKE